MKIPYTEISLATTQKYINRLNNDLLKEESKPINERDKIKISNRKELLNILLVSYHHQNVIEVMMRKIQFLEDINQVQLHRITQNNIDLSKYIGIETSILSNTLNEDIKRVKDKLGI